jgi:uncharacterized membrane protein
MTAQILTIVASVLAIIIGLWKYVTGKAAAKKAKQEAALKEIKDGIQNGDASAINSGFNDLNNGL